MELLKIFKIGGHIINDGNALESFLTELAHIEGRKLLVHGGGKMASDIGRSFGIEPQVSNGRSITDGHTLMVVTMVYAGLINKTIVGLLNAKGARAVGICGADNLAFPGRRLSADNIDYGFVADLNTETVNSIFLSELLSSAIPVIAPITADSEGTLLNVNADTVAATLAIALSKNFKTELYFCFEKDGIYKEFNNENKLIPDIKGKEIKELKSSKAIELSLHPKLENAERALSSGVSKVVVCNYRNIQKALKGEPEAGTYIYG